MLMTWTELPNMNDISNAPGLRKVISGHDLYGMQCPDVKE